MMQTIILIEDDEAIAQTVHDVLEMAGYQVISFAEPEPVSAGIKQAEPDAFLIDIMLPRISGIELAHQLRHHGYEETCMIAMSASDLMTHAAQQSGLFTETLEKPFSLQTLLDTVEHCLHTDVEGSNWRVSVRPRRNQVSGHQETTAER